MKFPVLLPREPENLQSEPANQVRSSPFWTFVSSVPVACLMAILLTKVAIVILGPVQAAGLIPLIQTACLGGGAFGTLAGGSALMQRSLKITDAKTANNANAALAAFEADDDAGVPSE